MWVVFCFRQNKVFLKHGRKRLSLRRHILLIVVVVISVAVCLTLKICCCISYEWVNSNTNTHTHIHWRQESCRQSPVPPSCRGIKRAASSANQVTFEMAEKRPGRARGPMAISGYDLWLGGLLRATARWIAGRAGRGEGRGREELKASAIKTPGCNKAQFQTTRLWLNGVACSTALPKRSGRSFIKFMSVGKTPSMHRWRELTTNLRAFLESTSTAQNKLWSFKACTNVLYIL